MARPLTRAVVALLLLSFMVASIGCTSTGWFRPKEESKETGKRRKRSIDDTGFFQGSIMEQELFGDEE
jgi:hypothetical protein